MASTNQPNRPSTTHDPFLIRPEKGETADEFADRVIALMGHTPKKSTEEGADARP